MRVIEEEMLAAIQEGRSWKKANTLVTFTDSRYAEIYLHEHHIATINTRTGSVKVNTRTLAVWPTRTTMSRLRALGVNVCQRKGVIYLNDEEL